MSAADVKPAVIYALCDPGTEEVRYIGNTASPTTRLRSHLAEARTGHPCHRCWWLRSLGEPPTFRSLAVLPPDSGQEMEIRTIALFRSLGYRLTNGTDGGIGGAGRRHTREAKARMSAAKMGHTVSAEHRARIAEANRRRINPPRTPEQRARMSAAIKASIKRRREVAILS